MRQRVSGLLKFVLCFVFCLLLLIGGSAFASEPFHHNLKIEFEPSSSNVKVQDQISIKTIGSNCDIYSFYLHIGMKLDRKEISPGWTLLNEKSVAGKPHLQKIIAQKTTRTRCPDELIISLAYSGFLMSPSESVENSSMSDGVVFSSSDFFYPVNTLEKSSVTFDLVVSLPDSWESVSQGMREKLKAGNGRKVVRWRSALPSEEIFLIANRFTVYEEQYKGMLLYAFLLQDEVNLANKYIQTAKYYIDLYSKLLGPYPYSKFALVENAKQTGYGMPSFTLMGSRIIRFPFILHSSYPHEILHNWWGNGVFADPEDGNWSEGLTAYLADHLILELKGQGSRYRFQEMMKYLSYVNDSNEFPIKDFSHRDGMASQAIGYGKLLMVFHMLRSELGDEVFLWGVKKYYKKFKYRYAGFKEMQSVFESVSAKNLDWFFEQWIQWKGAPQIELVDASYVSVKDRYDLSFEIKQTAPPYKLKLPVAIWKEGSNSPEIHYLLLDQARQKFHLAISNRPQAIRIDPYNEIFRKLDPREVPASIGQTFGASDAVIVLPVEEESEILKEYRQFSNFLIERGNSKITIQKKLVNALPTDVSLWVLGKNNEAGKSLIPRLKLLGIDLNEKGFSFKEGFFSLKEHSFVFTFPRTENVKGTITWLIASSAKSIPGLIRKLPHYGKYGYLVFEGDAPENIAKGAWPSIPVSLQKIFSKGNYFLPSQTSLLNVQPMGMN